MECWRSSKLGGDTGMLSAFTGQTKKGIATIPRSHKAAIVVRTSVGMRSLATLFCSRLQEYQCSGRTIVHSYNIYHVKIPVAFVNGVHLTHQTISAPLSQKLDGHARRRHCSPNVGVRRVVSRINGKTWFTMKILDGEVAHTSAVCFLIFRASIDRYSFTGQLKK